MKLTRDQQRAFFAKNPKILGQKKLTKHHYFTYGKDGLGGLQISAKNLKEAKSIANDQWGRGAKVEPDSYSEVHDMFSGDEEKVNLYFGMIPDKSGQQGGGGSSSADKKGLELQKSGIYARPSKLAKGGFIDPHKKN